MKRVETVITDDITGEPGAETVRFSVDGKVWEIDLTEQTRAELMAALSTFIERGRPVRGGMHLPGHQVRRRRSPIIVDAPH
jgi:hypothetical protein